jgi:MoxR-like ATPase
LERFLLRMRLGYPEPREEIAILERFQAHDPLRDLAPVATLQQTADL